MYRCSMRGILTEKLLCNGFLSSQRIAIPLFQNSNKDKEFCSISDTDMRIQKIQTSDRGPPHPLAGPVYYVFLVVYDGLVCHLV